MLVSEKKPNKNGEKANMITVGLSLHCIASFWIGIVSLKFLEFLGLKKDTGNAFFGTSC